MPEIDDLLDRLEQLLAAVENFDDHDRECVFELLDGFDQLHRIALRNLAAALPEEDLEKARAAHPSVAWLFDAYSIGVDEVAAAERAIDSIRPYVHSHGGEVDVLSVCDGVVTVRMSGTCSGCTASNVTLTEGVERALREGWQGFARLEILEEHEAKTHPPPGPTLLQIEPPPRRRDSGAA